MSIEQYKNIKFQIKDQQVHITIDRPPLNILNTETIEELIAALKKAEIIDEVKVIVIKSAGHKTFCAGVEIIEHMPDKVEKTLNTFNNLFETLAENSKVIIAVVQGYALGGGFELALGCDMIVASENAKFAVPEIKVGSMPPVAIAFLHRIVGKNIAAELILTGEKIDASEAYRLGIINKVTSHDKLELVVEELSQKLTGNSAAILKIAKKALIKSLDQSPNDALDSTTRLYLDSLIRTDDAVEGLKAFIEKRKAVWKNR